MGSGLTDSLNKSCSVSLRVLTAATPCGSDHKRPCKTVFTPSGVPKAPSVVVAELNEQNAADDTAGQIRTGAMEKAPKTLICICNKAAGVDTIGSKPT